MTPREMSYGAIGIGGIAGAAELVTTVAVGAVEGTVVGAAAAVTGGALAALFVSTPAHVRAGEGDAACGAVVGGGESVLSVVAARVARRRVEAKDLDATCSLLAVKIMRCRASSCMGGGRAHASCSSDAVASAAAAASSNADPR